MCSNYRPPSARKLARFGVAAPDHYATAGDAYPGSAGPMVLRATPGAALSCVLGSFGMLPIWSKDRAFAKRTYNARVETVAEKPSFREAWRGRRLCIVPAEAIYEPNYETGKAVWWRIQRADGEPMALAGLWERKQWHDGGPTWSFTMLTVSAKAHPVMRRFHKPGDEKRTVVVLDGGAIDEWLDARAEEDLRRLLVPCAPDLLVAAPGRLPAPSET